MARRHVGMLMEAVCQWQEGSGCGSVRRNAVCLRHNLPTLSILSQEFQKW